MALPEKAQKNSAAGTGPARRHDLNMMQSTPHMRGRKDRKQTGLTGG
jgi:hypothetical protein